MSLARRATRSMLANVLFVRYYLSFVLVMIVFFGDGCWLWMRIEAVAEWLAASVAGLCSVFFRGSAGDQANFTGFKFKKAKNGILIH